MAKETLPDLKDLSFLVMGLVKTSRTETIENYLVPRARSVGVVGLMSPFATINEARFTFHRNGEKRTQHPLPSFIIRSVSRATYPLILISFACYVVAALMAILKSPQKKYDAYIGVATASGMLGLILKRLGVVKKVIYYCIDYYPPDRRMGVNRLLLMAYRWMETYLVKHADVVWEISPRIKVGREKYANVPKNRIRTILVPLGYTGEVRRNVPFEEKARWRMGFVGTLTENQGLQLVIQAMPRLIRLFPEISVHVIGHGPSSDYFKQLTHQYGVANRFVFQGFVREDKDVYEILSRCALGLATWTGDEADNSQYADPGKPKLYALLTLPVIITSAPWISEIISRSGAGEKISYCVSEFVAAVRKILGDDAAYASYLQGIERFKPYCDAETIFDQAFRETLSSWHGNKAG